MNVNRIRTFYIDDNGVKIEYDPDTGIPVDANPSLNDDIKTVDDSDNQFLLKTISENKGSSHPEPYEPTDPDPNYEQYLEDTGATIHSSITYFPASKSTLSKRSMTHDEIADERGYLTR